MKKIILIFLFLLVACTPQQEMQMDHGDSKMMTEKIEAQISIEINPKDIKPNEEAELIVSIKDSEGNPLSLDTVHEKKLHFLVVSEDLEIYQHIHSENELEESKNGMFYLKTSFPQAGKYRMVVDVTHMGKNILKNFDVVVGERKEKLEIKTNLSRTKQLDNYIIKFLALGSVDSAQKSKATEIVKESIYSNEEVALGYLILDNKGNSIEDLQPYLGEMMHAVYWSTDLSEFGHLHPVKSDTKTIIFETSFPKPGIYKIFAQFKHKDVVRTVPFMVEVE